jgi:hypothetical protein
MIMRVRMILWVLLLGTGCHSGLLPCPHAKTVRMRKTNVNKPLRQFMASMSANADNHEVQNIHNKYRSGGGQSTENLTVEEWDCPRPGAKKYMPKSVRDNIKKNFKKVKTDSNSKADSTQAVR